MATAIFSRLRKTCQSYQQRRALWRELENVDMADLLTAIARSDDDESNQVDTSQIWRVLAARRGFNAYM
jgi:hypothetical protein